MMNPRYIDQDYERLCQSSKLPNSPSSLGMPMMVPGSSRNLEHAHKIIEAAQLIKDQHFGAGWTVAP